MQSKGMAVYMEININVIKQLIESLDKSGVDKLHLNTKDFDITLEKNQQVYTEAKPVQVQINSAPTKSATFESATNAEAISAEPKGNIVKAPIIGIFYVAPAPEKPPFVSVGQKVQKGDVIFIIESMKLMNEVTSEYSGTVAEIYIEAGNAVEYGQAIMRIE
jgi:acetyl-CoA carboxylase biotin carboxyl carrier protein